MVDLAETPYGGASDGIGTTAAAIVLLLAFGSLLAMSLPVVTALFGIGTGLSLIALIGHLIPAPAFGPIVASLIGLGVGVDYALFLFTRFRDELRAGARPEDALAITMRTAGRSVLTAGLTVAIGMLSLLVLRQSLLNGVAVAAAVTVGMTVLASLTLLPALLRCTGPGWPVPPASGGCWLGERLTAARSVPEMNKDGRTGGPRSSSGGRWSRCVSPRASSPLLAAPALGMKLSFPDESAQARGTMGYASYATMADGFGPGFDAPLIVAARLPRHDGGASGSRASRWPPRSAAPPAWPP